jgi:hypothetical protein
MSEIRATTISNAAGTGPVALYKQSAAKAWVNFNGTGTPAIRDSENVASLTDNGTGECSTNFTASMSSANYVGTGTSGGTTGVAYACFSRSLLYSTTASTFSSGVTYTDAGANADIEYNLLAIHGDLA